MIEQRTEHYAEGSVRHQAVVDPPGGVAAAVGASIDWAMRVSRKARPRLGCNGQVLVIGGLPSIVLIHPAAFYGRVVRYGLVGLCESYQAGEWDCADTVTLLTTLARWTERPQLYAGRLRRLLQPRNRLYASNTPSEATRDSQLHYDLSNDLFRHFLDDTMTYSAALFECRQNGLPNGGLDDLTTAQGRKIDRLLDLTGVGSGSRVLEIGCGWGELARRAAARGAYVDGVTNSARQHELAVRRVAEAGLSGHVRLTLSDYRDLAGWPRNSYDAVVSVEMIEGVGEQYLPTFFEIVRGRLAADGKVGVQAITMRPDRFNMAIRSPGWIKKHVYPGAGVIPPLSSIDRAAARAGLRITQSLEFGPHYAETLRLWQQRFAAREDDIEKLGFDDVFRRTWRLYLAYCEAGFRLDYLRVGQYVLEPGR